MKEVLEYLFGRLKDKTPVTHEVNGQAYAVQADGTLGAPVRELVPQFTKPALLLSTVSGLITAWKSGLDDLPKADVAFNISDPVAVQLVSLKADSFGSRHIYARANHCENSCFQFGKYYEPDAFLIAFRAGFYFNEFAEKVQRLCSSLEVGSSVTVANDGISQAVTIQQGAITRASVDLPPEIPLVPWRTFREVAPVESKFLLRMKAVKDSLPTIAIFEVDGKWRLDTIASIEKYILKHLPEAVVIA